MSTDKSLVRFVKKEAVSMCGRIVYKTNYDNLYLSAYPSSNPITRQTEVESRSTSTYVRNRDDYLYHNTLGMIEQEFQGVLTNDCQRSSKRQAPFLAPTWGSRPHDLVPRKRNVRHHRRRSDLQISLQSNARKSSPLTVVGEHPLELLLDHPQGVVVEVVVSVPHVGGSGPGFNLCLSGDWVTGRVST